MEGMRLMVVETEKRALELSSAFKECWEVFQCALQHFGPRSSFKNGRTGCQS